MNAALACAMTVGLVLLDGVTAGASQSAPSPDLLLILDASGLMWEQIEGENKIIRAGCSAI